jgi:myo-inositol-1(or 4)-monophosphatase
MEPMANMALRAARLVAPRITRAFDRPDLIKVSEKSAHNYVTNIDLEVEYAIIDTLKSTFPHHSFRGEEGAQDIQTPDAEYEWIIDPIDGTSNFVHNIPHFCISIACLKNGKMEHGVILDPMRDEEFVASRGKGCQVNGRRVRTSTRPSLDGALISTGGNERAFAAEQAAIYQQLLEEGAIMRQAGSAALDLAWVAAGRLDAMWMSQLKIWDMAAGALMVQETGGLLGEFDGGTQYLKSGNIIAASPKCFRGLAPLVKRQLGKTTVVTPTPAAE